MPSFGPVKLTAINAADIQKTERIWLESGKNGKPLSSQTVLHYHRLLYRAMKHARRLGFVARNVVEDVEAPKVVRKEMLASDEAQTITLLDALNGKKKLATPILVKIHTGFRRGEIVGLRWQDVDLDGGCITVRQTVEQTKAGIAFKPPKTAKSRRSVRVPESGVSVLREHRAEQEQQERLVGAALEKPRPPLSRGRWIGMETGSLHPSVSMVS